MFDNAELIDQLDNLRKFALTLTGNIPDAEDLVNATVLRAIEKNEMFETGTDLHAWTSKIMFNLFATQYRRRARLEEKVEPVALVDNEELNTPQQETVVELSLVSKAIDRLSDEQRQILIMICVQEMKYEEVAEALNIPIGTVRSRLSRARENLQKMTGLGVEDGKFTRPTYRETEDLRAA
jgi:RNA polymerase sigma-70 factor (ECF subfamily)